MDTLNVLCDAQFADELQGFSWEMTDVGGPTQSLSFFDFSQGLWPGPFWFDPMSRNRRSVIRQVMRCVSSPTRMKLARKRENGDAGRDGPG